ncbi:MAG: 3-oxoacyl-ACP reductase FabG [Clostridia bacterium]|nr:MAG: 3-oxoacyl-ACP reductase FabG [Clostridia bacterium]
MGSLDGKAAIVTGGATGIGRAVALGLAREGADVAIFDIRDAADTVKEVKSSGRRGEALKVDVTKKGEVVASVDRVASDFGRLDILVNNAGIYPASPFLETSEEEMDTVFAVNLKGPFLCTQAALKHMVSRQYGRIINVSSAQALIGFAIQAHYTATKGGIAAVTRALAAEFGPLGITVNAITPGLTTTETVVNYFPSELLATIEKRMALNRLGVAEDYAGIVAFLASDAASYITGAVIPVDGGMATCFAMAPEA